MTEESKPPLPCPEWCTDITCSISSFKIHDSRGLVLPEPSKLVAFAQQIDDRGKREPASVIVSVPDDGQHDNGIETRARIELSANEAHALGLIIDDAAKSGIKGVRVLGKGLREFAALIKEPEVDEPEAGA
jgi:hypothetical protein